MLDETTSPQTHAIIGAMMEVHSFLGPGFLEGVYQEALEMELQSRGIPFESQVTLGITYKGQLLKHTYKADLLCYGRIIVELKASRKLTELDQAQVINYLRVSTLKVALLANFGERRLNFERIVNGVDDDPPPMPESGVNLTSA